MHNAEKPNPPASVRDTGGPGGLSVSSKTRARNSLRAVAPQSAPSGEVHGEGGLPGGRNVTSLKRKRRAARPGPTAPTIRYATTNRDHDPVIFLTEERLLSAVSPLGDMVGHARSYHTRQSSHGGKLTRPQPRVKR